MSNVFLWLKKIKHLKKQRICHYSYSARHKNRPLLTKLKILLKPLIWLLKKFSPWKLESLIGSLFFKVYKCFKRVFFLTKKTPNWSALKQELLYEI